MSLDIDYNSICEEVINKSGTSIFNILITLLSYIISNYSKDKQSIIIYPIGIKLAKELIFGGHINSVVFPFSFNKNETFLDLIENTKDFVNSIRNDKGNFSYLPISEVIKTSSISKLDISFAQTDIRAKPLNFNHCNIEVLNRFPYLAGSNISLKYQVINNKLKFKLAFNSSLFETVYVKQILQQFHKLFKFVLVDKKITSSLKDYNILDKQTYDQIIYKWNETDKNYPRDKTIHRLFEDQVAKTPNNIALVYDDQELTYKELNEKSNQIARYIRNQYYEINSKELTSDTLIILCLERSLEMVIGILAVLKAGGAYVPIDPNYPDDRFNHIISDTGSQFIITQNQFTNKLSLITDKFEKLICLLEIDLNKNNKLNRIYKEQDKSNLVGYSKSTDLAYVIYTSGTTGLPKGVMIEHSGVASFSRNSNFISYQKSSVFAGVSNYAFDGSIFDIFVSLLNGKKLTILRKNCFLNISELTRSIDRNNIDTIFITTALFNTLVDNFDKFPSNLKQVLFGGEKCDLKRVNKFKLKNKNISLVHVYGPTENVVYSTFCNLLDYKNNLEVVPIGKALNGKLLYVLDQYMQPVPIGVVGELYIGGAGLARGYLNRPELTTERFVPNPFATESDIANGYTRLYKTGDLVRWLPDGNIEYIGRNDFQVKIRGYRIELGEVESQLAKLSGIKQAVVLAKVNTETKSQYLVGYYVPEHLGELKQEDLLTSLSEVLPNYMVPSILVELESFPLTVNGKLDRKVLPVPEFIRKDNYIAPSSELESKACTIFAEILGLDISDISTSANFFRMGGNSILSIKLKQKLNQIEEFKDITVADIFTYNTVRALVNEVRSTGDDYNLPSLTSTQSHEIAIIGTSGVFTGSYTVEQLWNILEANDEAIEFLNVDECRELGVSEELLSDANYVPVSGRVKDIDLFDPSFWKMSPNEAKQLDPQIRKFLEHSWYVLEQSGYSQSRKQDIVGIFAGMGRGSYFHDHILNGELKDEVNLWEASASNSKDALATKVAYLLGLTGPAHSVNTACSTGLVSVVDACRNLSLNTCNIAIAGGVSLKSPDQVGYLYQEGVILSHDGYCRTFDANANGTTGGSGTGVVLLKRLDDAIRDKDNILGVIKGYATNNDGDRKSGYTAPSVTGQSECIISAQKMAGIDVNDIDYVECHGTATKLGDPIEVQALQEAFKHNGYSAKDKKVILGAIKANIGHTDSAAGTAGLIKVTEMYKHDLIPGQPNFKKPNPELNIESTPFEIAQTNSAWLSNRDKPRLAGVSAFGIGGTNAHVIVSDYYKEAKKVVTDEDNQEYIIPITAKSRKSLLDYQKTLASYLENNEVSLRDLAYTLTYRREQFKYRTSFVVNSKEELIDQLSTKTSFSELPQEEDNTIVFIFPGQGNQYLGMAKELYDNDEKFQEIVDKTIEIANRYLEEDLKGVLFNKTSEQINQTEWSQICLFVIEYSLARYLNILGIKADAYIGHSIGEYVAATLSGVFKLEDAIKLVIARGQCMQAMPKGSMLSINANKEEVESYIQQNHCEIAVINSIEDIVVSGKDEDISNLHNLLKHKAIPSIKLNTSHAYHSRLMEEASNSFKAVFEGIQINTPKQSTISNVTGEISKEEITRPEYWQQQIRSTVEFAKGIETLSNKYNNRVTFIEVGPGKSSVSFVEKYKKYISSKTIDTVQMLPSQKQRIERNISQQNIEAILWQNNLQKDINTQVKQSSNLITNLPTYQFNFQSCWIEKSKDLLDKQFNSLDEMYYEKTWKRVNIETLECGKISIENQRVLILISNVGNYLDKIKKLTEWFKKSFKEVFYFYHKNNESIDANSFDFNDKQQLEDTLNNLNKIDSIAYISNQTDILNPSLDVIAIKNIFESADIHNKGLVRFISISINNYDVLGLEELSNSPTIIPGITKSIPYEYTSMISEAIHLDVSSFQFKENLSQLRKITSLKIKDIDLIAIRGKHLWEQVYEKDSSINNLSKSSKNNNKVIVITGGLGAIGYSYAKYIINHSIETQVFLIGRKPKNQLTHKARQRLEELQKLSNIEYVSCDISTSNNLSNLTIMLEEQNIKTIDYVVHTAGVAAKSVINSKTVEDINSVINPKIVGVNNIQNLAQKYPIKNLLLCSSISSIVPSVGNLEYTASNLYLDELVYRSVNNIRYIKSININQISDIGMAVDFIESSTIGDKSNHYSENSLLSNELAKILNNLCLLKSNRNIAISRYPISHELNKSKIQLDFMNKNNTKLTDLEIVESNYTDKEYQIAKIFAGVLGMKKLSLCDDFFELGGNSILAIKLITLLSSTLKIDISLVKFIKYSSIKKIANYTVIEDKKVDLLSSYEGPDTDTSVIFIHPAAASSEVYQSLISKLKKTFKCYGLNNYNIIYENKCSDISKLSSFYIDECKRNNVFNKKNMALYGFQGLR